MSMEIVGVIVLTFFGFYSVKLLTSFRKGILELGWRRVSTGAIFLILGQFPFLLSGIVSAEQATSLQYVGNLFRFIGIIFIALGFKTQYE
ncbi:MAG: hypothetical protein OK457_10190, partial [Thaumarchaeota archaeon]|nr:hypothetical protein [Nitrososphaerota archaeon]